MTAVGDLARLAQTGTALATAGHSLKLAKKKKVNAKDLMSSGMGTIIGTSFVRAQGSLISGL